MDFYIILVSFEVELWLKNMKSWELQMFSRRNVAIYESKKFLLVKWKFNCQRLNIIVCNQLHSRVQS